MESPPSSKREPSMAEKFLAFGRKVVAVPKSEIDRREKEYKKERATKRKHQS